MDQLLLDKHEDLVLEIANATLEKMQFELGKKYKKNDHQVNLGLSDEQFTELRKKYNLTISELLAVFAEFRKLQPTKHLNQVMDAFASSGGSVDIEPAYDENSQRLNVSVIFVIKDKELDKIEGLSGIEDYLVKMNAMIQVENVLAGSDPDMAPEF